MRKDLGCKNMEEVKIVIVYENCMDKEWEIRGRAVQGRQGIYLYISECMYEGCAVDARASIVYCS